MLARAIPDLLTQTGDTIDSRSQSNDLFVNFSRSSDFRSVSEKEIVATGHLLRAASVMVRIKSMVEARIHRLLNATP